jgi:hypothetical protein
MGSAPAEHAGIASAVNNDVARFGGLLAVAVLPPIAGITGTAYLHPAQLAVGFRTAVLIAAVMSAVGGILAAFTIRNPPRPAPAEPEIPQPAVPVTAECLHCALDGPPLRAQSKDIQLSERPVALSGCAGILTGARTGSPG